MLEKSNFLEMLNQLKKKYGCFFDLRNAELHLQGEDEDVITGLLVTIMEHKTGCVEKEFFFKRVYELDRMDNDYMYMKVNYLRGIPVTSNQTIDLYPEFDSVLLQLKNTIMKSEEQINIEDIYDTIRYIRFK